MNGAIPDVSVGPARGRGPFQVREVAYGPGLRQPRHVHGAASVTLVLSGRIRETAGSREEIGSALSVVVKPAGVEHTDEVGHRGARTLQIVLDGRWLGAFTGGAELPEWRWLHGRPVAATMLTLLRLVRSEGQGGPALEDGIVDALGALPDDPPLTGSPPQWLRKVREAVNDELPFQTSVRDLAARVGAHPVSVSRAFRRHYGCSITDYRRRERLRRAATSIEGSALALSRIAHDSGYADHPHLCREFRLVAGVTPSRFRRLAREG